MLFVIHFWVLIFLVQFLEKEGIKSEISLYAFENAENCEHTFNTKLQTVNSLISVLYESVTTAL